MDPSDITHDPSRLRELVRQSIKNHTLIKRELKKAGLGLRSRSEIEFIEFSMVPKEWLGE